jgi:hypothetical protein
MNIIMQLVIIIYILFILNIYIIIEIYNYKIKKTERNLYNKLYTELVINHESELVSESELVINRESELVINHESELVSESELDSNRESELDSNHTNIYECINVLQNNYAIDSYFIKNTNNTNKFNSVLSSLKDELNTCNILYNNTLVNTGQYESYKQIKLLPLSKCDEEYFDYYIYNIYSGEICNELNILNNDCSQFNIITLMLGLERCNN